MDCEGKNSEEACVDEGGQEAPASTGFLSSAQQNNQTQQNQISNFGSYFAGASTAQGAPKQTGSSMQSSFLSQNGPSTLSQPQLQSQQQQQGRSGGGNSDRKRNRRTMADDGALDDILGQSKLESM